LLLLVAATDAHYVTDIVFDSLHNVVMRCISLRIRRCADNARN
jgi:hypothetical protein